MKMKLLAIIALCCTFFVLALNPPKAYACYCAKGTVEVELVNADAVFMGKVVGVRNERRSNGEFGSFTANIYTISVSEAWKGVDSPKIEAIFQSDYQDTAGNTVISDCDGFGLELGQTYLLYSHHNTDTNEYYAALGSCSRSSIVSEAVSDIQLLGPGTEFSIASVEFDGWVYFWVGIGVVIVVAGGTIYWMRRRRSNSPGL